MRSIDNRRGSFLAQTMVIVALLALIASLVLRLSFGRRIISHRADESGQGRQRVLAVESHLYACLEGTTFGRTDCILPSSGGCPMSTIDGHPVTVTASGTAPNCRISIIVGD